MSLWKIAWRSIQTRALASALTAVAMGLGVALVVAVLVIYEVVDHTYRRGGAGCDLIVGAKGDGLSLVLNSAYYLKKPIGNIPYSYYRDLVEGYVEPKVQIETAVPICMGDSFEGHPVIGTTPEMFDEMRYLGDRPYEFDDGGNFTWEDHTGAVVGWAVARQEELGVDSEFKTDHGTGEGAHAHEQIFTVRGVLKHTGTPVDRAVFVNMEGFYSLHVGEACDDTAEHEDHPPGETEHVAHEPGSNEDTGDPDASSCSLSGFVYVDRNNDGRKDPEETALPHVTVTLTRTDADGTQVTQRIKETDHAGFYRFTNLPAGTYTIFETQPGGYFDGIDHVGTAGGEESNDRFANIELQPGVDATDYNFGEQQGVTAVLVCLDEITRWRIEDLKGKINRGPVAQAASPIAEITGLLENIVGKIQELLLLFAVLIVIVAGIGIMVSIYNSMSDRRHEIAVMRALGAGRVTVMVVILLESILLSLGGGAIGILLGHGLIGVLSPTIFAQTGVAVGPFDFRLVELVLIPGLIILASLVGYLPAKTAYRTDVARSLTANP
ncbi:MAG TPA: FtsX-like permease family protein [Thermoguttaceae bacterium]|nr:FtsX-like permease family protein [Thermoguttaceae bacterium]